MKTIHIIDPSPDILVLQVQTVVDMVILVPSAAVEAVGSMAVPVCGKNEIDIMVVSDDVAGISAMLVNNGYRQGPIEKGISYLNKYVGETEVAVQVIPNGHKMIEIHRVILHRLQSDQGLRDRYAAFKRTLDGLPSDEYKTRKSEWIRANLL
ncbi:MAG TPA: GrpB family protein [Candidatus Paceibacterota bacterium]